MDDPLIYRGYELSYDRPPISFRGWDWSAVEPNSDGKVIANGATREECEAAVDEYILHQEEE